jgi:hypothetical protein
VTPLVTVLQATSATSPTITLSASTIALFTSILGFLIAVFTLVTMWTTYLKRVRAEAERTGRLELKVDTMWDLMFKSSQVHARQRGVLRASSPLYVDAKVRAQFTSSNLGPEILQYYAKSTVREGDREVPLRELLDREIGLIFARAFGDDLIERICLPLAADHVTLGDALVAAVQLCREEDAAHGSDS